MKYDICIIGHGDFPMGIDSDIKTVAGTDELVTCLNLDEHTTHEKFTQDLDQYLDTHENVIVFADMTGGAPYQIAAKRILTNPKDTNKYVLSGVSMNLVLDVYLKNLSGQLTAENIEDSLNHVIEESKSMMQSISQSTISKKA
ncbi:PTS fructose transporter subunit IIA [Lactobacillus sp. ESL0679]|uniref:PTS sugar transporter subunit IIA n=1 Tax=Lactobacillus sp. ESL0679 TaxID=2983209 RepID=UPI0023F6B500|nr:PTS fructose transporter subunit IIA [Lactobacillus sp. ESL0679]MDF7683560.1 PTS fructose transporter subunit IIA [Lactobacillus sp. ESL0679]